MLSTWMTKLNTDGHVVIGLFIFIVGSALHYFHGIDVAFVSFTTTVLAFLGGHAYIQKGGSDGSATK